MRCNVAEGITGGMMNLLAGAKRHDAAAAVALTCQAYCAYYKGDDGEEGCGGLAAVGRGLISGVIGFNEVNQLVDMPPGPARRYKTLTEGMCAWCSYLEGGCDFMSPSPPPGATPCGGYRLLLALMDQGALTEDEVKAIIQDAGRIHRRQG